MILLRHGLLILMGLSTTGRFVIMHMLIDLNFSPLPLHVVERLITATEEFDNKKPPTPLLISYDPEDIRKQAAASTQRFEEGKPLSFLDGIFMAIRDDIDCYPHPFNGIDSAFLFLGCLFSTYKFSWYLMDKDGTTWFHEVHKVKEDAASVSRLRCCGVILVGKANMHEFGMGTTGNNPNHGRARNLHAPDRYCSYCCFWTVFSSIRNRWCR